MRNSRSGLSLASSAAAILLALVFSPPTASAQECGVLTNLAVLKDGSRCVMAANKCVYEVTIRASRSGLSYPMQETIAAGKVGTICTDNADQTIEYVGWRKSDEVHGRFQMSEPAKPGPGANQWAGKSVTVELKGCGTATSPAACATRAFLEVNFSVSSDGSILHAANSIVGGDKPIPVGISHHKMASNKSDVTYTADLSYPDGKLLFVVQDDGPYSSSVSTTELRQLSPGVCSYRYNSRTTYKRRGDTENATATVRRCVFH